MPENHLFEYAVIRIVPRTDREEFINTGVVLYCRKLNFLQTMFTVNENRILGLFSGADVDQLRNYLWAFEKIACGDTAAGPIGKLDTASRFRWLTASRSTVLQTSRVHPGLCIDPLKMLNRLYEQMVL